MLAQDSRAWPGHDGSGKAGATGSLSSCHFLKRWSVQSENVFYSKLQLFFIRNKSLLQSERNKSWSLLKELIIKGNLCG